eukprot:3058314-Heterocapsa_arctica.AAC.1
MCLTPKVSARVAFRFLILLPLIQNSRGLRSRVGVRLGRALWAFPIGLRTPPEDLEETFLHQRFAVICYFLG